MTKTIIVEAYTSTGIRLFAYPWNVSGEPTEVCVFEAKRESARSLFLK